MPDFLKVHGWRILFTMALGVVAVAALPSAVFAVTKGPDASGYKATDETVYSFVDIAGGSGGASLLKGTDDGMAALTLPFAFRFYGQPYTVVCVSTNGALYFVTSASVCSGLNDFANTDVTTTAPPNDLPAVLPFWSDLTLQVPGAGAVFYQTLGAPGSRRFIVQWDTVYPQASPNPVTFQAILSEGSNGILFQYKAVGLGPGNPASNGAQATVGIRNAGALSNQQQVAWSFDSPVIGDNTALLFSSGSLGSEFVTVTSPNREVSWAVGTLHQITWEHNLGRGAAVNIEVSRDGGAWTPVATAVPNTGATTGRYGWLVSGAAVAHARIRVQEAANPAVNDISDVDFAVVSPTVTVTSPNGSGSLRIGSTWPIHVRHNLGLGQPITLEVSRQGVWSPITPGPVLTASATSETFDWVVTGPATTGARIRASWASDPSVSDTSDVDFAIADPFVKLTDPNRSGSVRIGTPKSIPFSHNLGVGQAVHLDISRDGGPWGEIAVTQTTLPTAGAFEWVVTGPPTLQVRFRARWGADERVFDMRDHTFTIESRITVMAPHTAVKWLAGSEQLITWQHNLGAAETVNIDISRDGGMTWSPVAVSVPNGGATSGSYLWMVTGPATSHARIRLSRTIDPSASDISDVEFNIR